MQQESESSSPAILDPELKAVIRRVGSEVLETMFFAEAVPMDCSHCWAPALVARVCFNGSHSGEFLLRISEDAVGEIASAFLGLDPEESGERDRGHVILELSNILCGAMLSSVWPESNLMLSAPEACDPDQDLENSVHQCFTMPSGMLSVSLAVHAKSEV